jgi:hypothetical protein
MRYLTLLAMALTLVACGDREKSAHNSRPPTPAQCSAAGALACPIAPVESLQGACAQLRECLSSIPRGKEDALQITSCDAPTVQTRLASTAAPIEALAVITVDVQQGTAPSHAAYVFSKDSRGWCPSVELLEPLWRHGGQCETTVQVGADTVGAAVRAERTCRIPLDRSQRDVGASDVAERECVQARYALSQGALKEASRQRSEGACPAI